MITVGHNKVGHKSFNASVTEKLPPSPSTLNHSVETSSKDVEMGFDQDDLHRNNTHDDGGEILDILLMMEEQDTLKNDLITLYMYRQYVCGKCTRKN